MKRHPPSIGHNSAYQGPEDASDVDVDCLQQIDEIRRGNATALSTEQEGRRRRDNVLTRAALLVATLMADGVHRSEHQLRALAVRLDEPVTSRGLAAPASFLARLVLGRGRNPNTYTRLAAAGGSLASLPEGERGEAMARAGGVSGLAKRGAASPASAVAAATEPSSEPMAVAWTPGLAALVASGARRTVWGVIEVGGDAPPRVLIADVPGLVQLTKHAAIGDSGGRPSACLTSEECATPEPISRSVIDMVASGDAYVVTCLADADDARNDTSHHRLRG